MSNKKIAIVFFSGYGHTKKQAEAVAKTSGGTLIEINQNGEIAENEWDVLNAADAIVFGSPTYMGMAAWQFKKFADASSKAWFTRQWADKLFAGFTNSASLNGDKQSTIEYFMTLAMQHGGLWVGLGLMPANSKAAQRSDINSLGSSLGAYMQSPSDASVDEIPQGDLDTAAEFGKRVAATVARLA